MHRDFHQFVSRVGVMLQATLPGEDAQFKMAPYERTLRLAAYMQDPSPRKSAVMMLIYPGHREPHFSLILRNTYEGVHSAQVGFPGGKIEEDDSTPLAAALRELQEEIGVNPNQVSVLGELTQVYIPPSRFLVYPFVGYSETKPIFIRDPKEVQEIIEVPISALLDEKTVSNRPVFVKTVNRELNYPCFIFGEHVVWGATGMMLSEIKEILLQNPG